MRMTETLNDPAGAADFLRRHSSPRRAVLWIFNAMVLAERTQISTAQLVKRYGCSFQPQWPSSSGEEPKHVAEMNLGIATC
jgi:hypothetical protein